MSPGESTDPCYLTELLHVAMQVARDCDVMLRFCATLHITSVMSCEGYVGMFGLDVVRGLFSII